MWVTTCLYPSTNNISTFSFHDNSLSLLSSQLGWSRCIPGRRRLHAWGGGGGGEYLVRTTAIEVWHTESPSHTDREKLSEKVGGTLRWKCDSKLYMYAAYISTVLTLATYNMECNSKSDTVLAKGNYALVDLLSVFQIKPTKDRFCRLIQLINSEFLVFGWLYLVSDGCLYS